MKKNSYRRVFFISQRLKRLLLIMKTIVLLLSFTVFQVNASLYSQNTFLNLSVNDKSVKEVLTLIEKQSNYRFVYNEDFADLNKSLTFTFESKKLEEILDFMLNRSSVTYRIFENNVVVITPLSILVNAQKQKITGAITDASTGEPVIGASVIVDGTTIGTTTDSDGRFSIEVNSANILLVVSFIGYNTERIQTSGSTNLNIKLIPDITRLEEVVVVGYGTMKKSDITGAVVSVSGDKLKTSVVNTLDQVLQGRAAGVQVVNNSGQPGASTSIRIRGINSLRGSNEPLYVIDGVQYSGNGIQTLTFSNSNSTGAGNVNPLSSINPSDIESIEILKDAAACAIYGNQGANGVVLVTTKHGKANESKISYEYSTGWKSLAKKIDVLNLREFAEFDNEIYRTKGLTPRPEFANPETLTGGTDWQDAVFQVGQTRKHQFSVSGGTDKTTYYLGAGYQYDEGIVVNSWFERYNVRLNLENQTRSWLKIGTNLGISRSNTKMLQSDADNGPVMTALVKAPDIKVRNEDGTFAGPNATQNTGGFGATNPVALTEDYDSRQKNWDVMTNAYGELKWKKLTLRNEIGANIRFTSNWAYQKKVKYGEYSQATSHLQQAESRNTNIELKNILNYTNTFNSIHNINFMAAHESRIGRYDGLGASRKEFLNNIVIQMSNGDVTQAANSGYGGVFRTESYIGRLFYNYADLVMLTASYRMDGSYKFSKDNRWGAFPSISGAIRLSNFNFLKRNLGIINDLKINGSYGETGNSSISDYLYLAQVYTMNTALGQAALFSVPNLDITWETTKSSNIALEMGMYQNRVILQLELYKKKTVDALNEITLPDFIGANMGTMAANRGSIQNKGLEITLSTVNLSGEFNWKTDLTFTRNRNKVLSLGLGGVPITGGGGMFGAATSYTIEGGPIGRFYGYVADGVYQNLDDILTSALWSNKVSSISPDGLWLGDQKFKDIDKSSTGSLDIVGYKGTVADGQYVPGTAVYTGNPADILHLTNVSYIDDKDRTFIGDPNPEFIFSINNTFAYKNFDLTVFVNGVYGNDIFNYNKRRLESMYAQDLNYSRTVLTRAIPVLNTGGNVNNPADYTLKNPSSSVPRNRKEANVGADRLSTRFIEDGSFIRIQNVVLGYTLSKNIAQKLHIESLRVYANAQNLYTFTKYTGFDPEIGNQGQSSLLAGVDNGHYPIARSYSLGIQVNF